MNHRNQRRKEGEQSDMFRMWEPRRDTRTWLPNLRERFTRAVRPHSSRGRQPCGHFEKR